MSYLNIEKQKNFNLSSQINLYIKKINELNNKINLLQTNLIAKNEIKNLSESYYEDKSTNFSIRSIKPGEKIISIIFKSIDQKVNFSFTCKNTDIFVRIEEKLYKVYPEYKEYNNFFTVSGRTIKRFKSIEENNIKNADNILLNVYQ